MSQLTRVMTALGLGLLAAPSSAEYHPDLVFHGACTTKSFLNLVRFSNVGRTYSGAPYYKGTTSAGVDQYIYWDPDCAGGGDGAARWIVADQAPDVTRKLDLDGDGSCEYHARIDSTHKEFPPPVAFWSMRCGAPTSESTLVDLAAVTTTETRTTTTSSTSSSSKTATTSSGTTTTTTPMMFKLSGACPYKDFLNGLTFREEGTTVSGARYFKALEADQYLYHDVDCDGGSNGVKRWIIDSDMPDPSVTQDLDQDNKCNYHARLNTENTRDLPSAGTWQVWCGLGWVDTVLHLDNTGIWPHMDGQYESAVLELQGHFSEHECSQQEALNSLQFELQGTTAGGFPWYKAKTAEQYIYYDLSCSGAAGTSARWVIDEDAPNVSAIADLDGDRNCSYHARVKTTDGTAPPKGAMWRVQCNTSWTDMWLALFRLPVTTTVVRTKTTTSTTTKAAAKATTHDGVLNSATGLPHGLAVLGLGPLLLWLLC
eukprot:CAMPEP_0203857558 /NCGR_PEP_ID=MMETSP0359-20131031/10795_1 /ASSEMBLY_ACC=CAM_ASM_000338 /TAXON_ID=268821 /ORGANISM="Scrippsiella Hangoei, Strain SHTV-5" /LENGTH=483 /DNA_ID=CAMNT_0050774269 /DNA_START=27 /DNA_END=1478 /DNA_ORIENTATION=+